MLGIEIDYIKRNKSMTVLLLYVPKPFNYLLCVNSLIYVQKFSQIIIDSMKELLFLVFQIYLSRIN